MWIAPKKFQDDMEIKKESDDDEAKPDLSNVNKGDKTKVLLTNNLDNNYAKKTVQEKEEVFIKDEGINGKFKCNECNAEFINRGGLFCHKQTIHDELILS